MIITNFNLQKQLQCKRYYFLEEIYNKKKIVETKLKGYKLEEILSKMYDNLGNDLISLPSFSMSEYYEEFKKIATGYLDLKYLNKENEINKNYIIKNQYENINFECLYDYVVENENEKIFIKISLQTLSSFFNSIGKRNFLIYKKDMISLESKQETTFKKSELLDEVAFFKMVYENSQFYNKYKNNKYYILLINNDKQETKEGYILVNVSNIIEHYELMIKNNIQTYIMNIKDNILELEKCSKCIVDNKKCQFYCICNEEEKEYLIEEKEFINIENLQKEINKISYPIYYLDFESFSCPYPRFDKEKPYSQHVFLYSLIIQNHQDEQIRYRNYIAKDNKNDYREELFNTLVEDIDLSKGGTIIVYNETFEKSRIKEAMEYYPHLKSKLNDINNHIYDLMLLLKGNKDKKIVPEKCNYYNTKQNGSFSIKKVLPIFSEEGYALINIKNGVEASNVYANFHNLNEEELFKSKQDLIEYCNKDVYAMYIILKNLKRKVGL